MAIAIAVAFLVGMLLPVFLLRNSVDEVPAIGDIRALLPRNRAELPYGAGLALSAGIFEETLFRLGLPALVFGIIGDGPLAFLLCGVLFGLLHLYQKLTGVLVATVLGLVLAFVYVVSGSILLVIAIHAIIDLRSLVLLPWVLNGRPEGCRRRPPRFRWSRSPSSVSKPGGVAGQPSCERAAVLSQRSGGQFRDGAGNSAASRPATQSMSSASVFCGFAMPTSIGTLRALASVNRRAPG